MLSALLKTSIKRESAATSIKKKERKRQKKKKEIQINSTERSTQNINPLL